MTIDNYFKEEESRAKPHERIFLGVYGAFFVIGYPFQRLAVKLFSKLIPSEFTPESIQRNNRYYDSLITGSFKSALKGDWKDYQEANHSH